MVLENVRASLIGDDFYGMSTFGLFVLSCRFKLGSRDWDCSPSVCFPCDGVAVIVTGFPHKLPITGSISFSGTQPENGCWLD
jgi:hypothetical protein